MTEAQPLPGFVRRILREKYPYAWAYTLRMRLAESAPAYARAAAHFARSGKSLEAALEQAPKIGGRQ